MAHEQLPIDCAGLLQDWDEAVIAMLDRCPSDKCFISHYPPAHNDTYSQQVPVLCKSHFDEGAQMPSFEAMAFDFQVCCSLVVIKGLSSPQPLVCAELQLCCLCWEVRCWFGELLAGGSAVHLIRSHHQPFFG